LKEFKPLADPAAFALKRRCNYYYYSLSAGHTFAGRVCVVLFYFSSSVFA
jgi:hypothetical protein